MNAAERALLRERVKLVNIIKEEDYVAEMWYSDTAEYKAHKAALEAEVAELDAALNSLRKANHSD